MKKVKSTVSGIFINFMQMDKFEDYLVSIDTLNRSKLAADFGKKYTAIVLKKIKSSKGSMLVAVEGKRVIGFVAGVLEKQEREDYLQVGKIKYGRIIELYVAEEYRTKGIGKELFQAMEKYLVSSKCQVILVGVFAPNQNAYQFYKKLGYTDDTFDLIKLIK